ncbi:ABC transporter permease [Georgenia yuyongxinii]|uniref:ABC transporter permease n=1 Tax=Georgenia yuyongxinii TaxID=2589797 RepID=A0A5B8C3D8_9MICO|nr:ABC transporter permease [Georgenia yuyongxinii]QDC25249.1 ABC transporter permease [Georgenia yuyongxinii]
MRYVLGRVGQSVVVLLVAFTLSFALLHALPGDALLIKFENPELGLSQGEIAAIRQSYGADVPLVQQYLVALGGFVTGDLGYSVQYGTPVATLIAEAMPGTLALAAGAFALAVLLAVGIAALSTLAPFAWLAGALRSVPSLFAAVPVFWLAIVLVQVFSFQLGLVPVIAPSPAQALILPVLALAVPISAPLAQVLVRSIDDVRLQPFVAVTTAKGASPHWLLRRTIARNALLPTLTISGVLLGELIGGAVVTETVFGRAGVGRLTEQAVSQQDIPVLQGVVLVAAVTFVVVNLLVDLLYPVLDPRTKKKVALAA